MRKTIIPAAIVLAAPAVTMQAQELTKDALNARISAIMAEINKFPQKVKDEFAPQLSTPQNDLNAIDESKYVTDEQKAELETLLSRISATIEGILTKATEAQQPYADERDAAWKAIVDAKQALEDAKSAIKDWVVPSIVKKYYDKDTDKLIGVSAPSEYTEAQLYESIELSKKAKEEWEAYQTDINTLKKQAEDEYSKETKAQPDRLSELQSLIETYKSAAAGYYNTVSAYLKYNNQESDKTYFLTTAPNAFDSKGTEIENSKKSWSLTESAATTFKSELDGLKEDLDKKAETAKGNAKKEATANANKLTENLHAKYDESEDDDKFISEAKTAANQAILDALDKKAELSETLVATDHSTMAKDLEGLVTAVTPLVTAVTKAENNYAAYTALVKLHDDLKKAYDEVAIELSTMQANGEIDSKYYNEANNKLNVVAQNLAKLSKQNETNYDKQAYADYTTGTPDDDYNTAKSLLGDYDEASKIEKILEDAKKANDAFKAKLQEIEDLRNTVTADVTVTPTDEKYRTEADRLTEELTQKKNVVLGKIDTFKTAYKVSKEFDSDEFNAISQAVDGFNTAVTKAKADLKAYENSKNKLAEWTIAVNAIEVPDEEVNAAYPDPKKGILNGYIKNVKDIKADITSLEEDTKAAFAGPDRTSQAVWDIISGKDYDTTLPTLKTNLKDAWSDYKTWRDKQGDEDAYKLGKEYYDELSELFTAAVKNGAYEVDAEGKQAVQDAMDQFATELAQHKLSHAPNNCIALMDSWAKTYETVKASITWHEEVLAEYNKALPTLTTDGIKSADVKNLYDSLKDQSAIDAAITAAQGTLKEAYTAKVKATEGTPEYAKVLATEATNLQTGILNLIAQTSLEETYSAQVTTAINNVKDKLTSDLNPKYYTNLLTEKQTKYNKIVSTLTYESYGDAKKQEVENLITSINNVLLSAQANYDKYKSQMTAHENAKAKWASFYSSVGATYGDQFPGAQAIYQGELNAILKELNAYEATIKAEYQNGGSVALGDKDYSEIIGRMQAIADNAALNKTDYESQKKALSELQEKHYDPAIKELDDKIKTVNDNIAKAVGEENDEQIVLLKEQLESLEAYKDSLVGDAKTSINKRIEALTALVETAVNNGKSSANNKDYIDEVTTIRQNIASILGQAKGKYNENAEVHNTVIENLFMQAYNAAKAKYEKYALDINKYAGYTHALVDGKSAYEDCINTTHAAIFDLNTKLIAAKGTATKQFAADTQNGIYTDSSQPFAKKVKGYEAELDTAYAKFIADTRKIADGYAKPLQELADDYIEAYGVVSEYYIVTSIEGNTPEETKAKQAEKLATYFTSNGAQPKKDYEEQGPEKLDDLLANVDTQKGDVLTAWNKAAYDEATDAKSKAQTTHDTYSKKKYPKGYTPWQKALTAAQVAIDKAGTDITTFWENKTLKDEVDNIKTALTQATSDLEKASKTADTDCEPTFSTYKTYSKDIADKREYIQDCEESGYKSDLQDLITQATDSVNAYEQANEAAFNALYSAGTQALQALQAAETAANTALQKLQKKAEELVAANQPKVIVKTLLAKAQELVPLYNRAEANAKGESGGEAAVADCEKIYTDLNELLNRLNLNFDSTDPAVLEKIEKEAAAQQTTKDTIKNLRQRIIKADVEQKAYNLLLEELNGEEGVKAALGNVKTYIENSTFKTELNEAFSERIAALDIELSAALTQINIDHANNHCGKTEAVFKGFTAISVSIKTLDNEVQAKAGELQTAKDHAEMRAKNTVNYEAARDAIANADNKLQAEWFNAQESFKDVFTLFNERVEELRSNIATLQDNLTKAYNTAQNEDGDPSVLNTDDFTAKAAKYSGDITNLMTDISDRQTQFYADVESLKGHIAEMKADFAAIKISDVAAANEDVKKDKAAIETAISNIDKKMLNFGPNDTETVQGLIDAANTRITAFATLVAGKTYVPGDITGTGSVDINDTFKILALVLGKLSGDTLDEKAQKAADMDGDDAFTVADLVQINNLYVYGSKTRPQGSNRVAAAADAEVGSVDMQLYTDRMSVLLDSNTGYSAIQMDVEMPQGVSINEVNFAGDSQKVMVATNTLENGVQRIVIYSSDGSSILNGESSLLDLSLAGEGMGIVSIDHIIASTPKGQRHNLMAATGAYTIVTGIEATETTEGNTSVFDINGMVRKTVQKGINIVKDATGKVKKMLMK